MSYALEITIDLKSPHLAYTFLYALSDLIVADAEEMYGTVRRDLFRG